MLKTDHLFFNTASLVMNRYKNRAETGLQNLDNRAILCKVRGIGAAGSAFASHVKGRGFESHMLHGKGLVDTRPFIFVLNFLTAGSISLFLLYVKGSDFSCLCRKLYVEMLFCALQSKRVPHQPISLM